MVFERGGYGSCEALGIGSGADAEPETVVHRSWLYTKFRQTRDLLDHGTTRGAGKIGAGRLSMQPTSEQSVTIASY